ncbi:nucleotidyltransferase family protein [Dyadobacter psychrotolerans]|uniref:Nucleotidyltransferase family protein n=1 Tax=Dyadobacter psychrotolerans TaxID=2541721 RepID=A0A4R5DYG0_9BACT|nr:nucleotidyltransferase family protein [Dyadobacter psychrotolerans]TDE16405.1 nucleotidyltransferase family protein [Dyadobacter psychrotolerans]
MPEESYGIIILAAGNSSRLGEPKQLLHFKDKSLICHVAEEAIAAIGSPVIIVTGSNYELIGSEVKFLPIQLEYNHHWQEGMASSISTGISALLKTNPSIRGIVITVSDQPFVTSALFRDLIETAKQTSKGIVASAYENTLGTPVLFQSQYFEHLLNLKGSEGAKKLLKRFKEDVAEVSFQLGRIDIDTKGDYQNLLNSKF